MIYRIDFDEETRVALSHMMPVLKRHVKESLRQIAKNPHEGKPLEEDLKGYFTYRVGKLRIIYAIDSSKKAVHVVAIGPRRVIYEELSKRLKTRSPLMGCR
ncbi:MAG: type II toxin-antitoxin system RelE/ParE family toxin [Deltaproteobacteria bacterium]|nr:type II toxin-antitoxin system RelE/ParE family toxin [Deltaproteobacteria bacterium]MBI2500458.1 type II toxin-antitoxin system RelE/ParE family toxin [Deltaproteobacteria bacterium]